MVEVFILKLSFILLLLSDATNSVDITETPNVDHLDSEHHLVITADLAMNNAASMISINPPGLCILVVLYNLL